MKTKLIFDAHLDLSMNALEWNRDYTQPLKAIREREKTLRDKPDRGKGVISFDEMRKGNVGMCVATMIARSVGPDSALPGWHSPEQAWAQTQGQLAWYRAMEWKGEMVQIKDHEALETHLQSWLANKGEKLPIGYILSLEGADSILSMKHLERAYEEGLRALGPAHYGPGRYAFGTESDGPLNPKGKELLKHMERLNIILDVTHLSDTCFWEALDIYSGAIWASHNNCRTLVPHQRQFSDEQLRELIEREAVIGAAFDAWMLVPGWERGKTTPEETGVRIRHVVDHIDHVCQLAGNTLHSAIGTDLDGGYGKEQGPEDLDSIADLQKIPDLLRERGYTEADIENILYKNWIRFLKKTWA